MFKASMIRFFAVVIVVLCIGARVSADVFQVKGPGTKRIVFNQDYSSFKIDYSGTNAYYHSTRQNQYYTMFIGACKVDFKAEYCASDQNTRHHEVLLLGDTWRLFYDVSPSGIIDSSSISFHSNEFTVNNQPCNPQFDINSVPGKYVIDVSLSGEVSPDLIVNFDGVYIPTTTLAPTTTLTPTNAPKKLEVWQITLIVAGSVIILLAVIGLCIAVICCYRKKKAKAQKVAESEHSTAASTMGTTVGAFTNRETDLYGSDMMHISKNITEGGPNTLNSQAVSPAPQATSPAPQATSPAPTASPMPTPQ